MSLDFKIEIFSKDVGITLQGLFSSRNTSIEDLILDFSGKAC
jgi:hypothetical protein